MPPAFRMVCVALLALLPSVVARAQSPAPAQVSGVVGSVKASGSTRYSSALIADASGLKRGQPLAGEDLQAAADHLAHLGVFSDVRYRFATLSGAVEIEFQVADAPSLAPLFDNFPWFTDDEITQAVKSAVPLYDGRVPEGGTLLDEISQALVKLLATRQVSGSVAHQVIRLAASGENVQQFRVEGPELPIGSVEFSDSLAKEDHAIQQALSDIRGKPFSRAEIDRFIFEQIRPVYLAHGYMRVRFDPPQARFAGDPSKPLPNSVKAIITIQAGPIYKWGGATWSGNKALTAAELDALVGIKSGDHADGMKIEAAWQNILDAYGKKGYLDAALDKTLTLDDPGARSSYRVTVTEGAQYHMGALVLSGLSVEGERRILAAWKIPDGAVFDAGYADSFVNGGARAAFGDLPWSYEKVHDFLQKDPKTARVDVLMDFQ